MRVRVCDRAVLKLSLLVYRWQCSNRNSWMDERASRSSRSSVSSCEDPIPQMVRRSLIRIDLINVFDSFDLVNECVIYLNEKIWKKFNFFVFKWKLILHLYMI